MKSNYRTAREEMTIENTILLTIRVKIMIIMMSVMIMAAAKLKLVLETVNQMLKAISAMTVTSDDAYNKSLEQTGSQRLHCCCPLANKIANINHKQQANVSTTMYDSPYCPFLGEPSP